MSHLPYVHISHNIESANKIAFCRPSHLFSPTNRFIGASLSEPHTSGKNGMSIAFVRIYMEIQINGTNVMHSQKFTFKIQVIIYKCFQMCVHHTNICQSSLLTLHIRLVRAFITQRITRVY